MAEDDKLQDSLAAWVPPWQRAAQAKPDAAAADAAEPGRSAHAASVDVAAVDDLVGETAEPEAVEIESVNGGEAVDRDGPDDDDYRDVQQPETDFAPAAAKTVATGGDAGAVAGAPASDPATAEPARSAEELEAEPTAEAADPRGAGGGDDTKPDDPDDDYSDVQQPETDEFEGVSPEATILEEIDLDIETDDVTPLALVGRDDFATTVPAAAGAGSDADISGGGGEAAEAPVELDAPAGRPDDLRGALEAILLVVDEPVPDGTLADVLNTPAAEVIAALEALAAEYAEARRGYELRRAAGGWRLYTRGDYAPYVERFVLDGQSVRLTQAALETLAVVAYQQPVTRSRMSAIRGVNCDGVVRTLVTRGLIEECGTQPESGAFLYRTTQLFLEKLGLDSVDQLPPLAPFLPDDVNGLVDAER